MAIHLSEQDQRAMSRMINTVLDSYAKSEVSQAEACSVIAHVITSAAVEDEAEVRSWLTIATVGEWRKKARAAFALPFVVRLGEFFASFSRRRGIERADA